jgi:hypothetical protein
MNGRRRPNAMARSMSIAVFLLPGDWSTRGYVARRAHRGEEQLWACKEFPACQEVVTDEEKQAGEVCWQHGSKSRRFSRRVVWVG